MIYIGGISYAQHVLKVLVCEDDDVVLKVIQVALSECNVHAVFAKDGREALRLLNEMNDYGLIITDIHMPYHNGDEILQLVRVDQKKDTPIVMISSDAEEEVVALALKSGVDEFISKPVDPAKLMRKIKKFL